MDYAKESLRLHGEWGGKIEVVCTVPCKTKEDLSLAYTPGVAQPCLEIQKDVNKSYELTRRHNLCAVITDGTAVLGLGDIGPEAGMPVMEGKCALFKAFADVDAFPLCVKSKDVDEFVNAVYLMSGSFDLTVIISGRTLREVAQFVGERLAPIEGVTGTATHFILKKYKEKHLVFRPQDPEEKEFIFT